MKNTRFEGSTPGPWSANGDIGIVENKPGRAGFQIAAVSPIPGGREGNLSLIAAAPDGAGETLAGRLEWAQNLLASVTLAINAATKHLRCDRCHGLHNGGPCTDDAGYREDPELVRQAERILAKPLPPPPSPAPRGTWRTK